MSGTTARVKGHTLRYEGQTRGYWRSERMGPGPGICSCGVESEVLPTTAARQRWHRAHKGEVIAASTPNGTAAGGNPAAAVSEAATSQNGQ